MKTQQAHSGIRMSPSKLSLFLECPRCFWEEHNTPQPRPSGIFPSILGQLDRLMKDRFDMHRKEAQLPEEISRAIPNSKPFLDLEKLQEWRNWRKGISWTDHQGNTLVGAVDDVLWVNGKLAVMDYKSKGNRADDNYHKFYQHQLDCYAFLLDKCGFDMADTAYLGVYFPVEIKEDVNCLFGSQIIPVKVSVERARKLFENAVNTLNGPSPPSAEDCKYCAFIEFKKNEN